MKPESAKPNITKAEVLWTRICSLKCSYCAMVDGRRNTVCLEDWERGLSQLKKLGCSFLAFYGAEPLDDFDKLPEVIFTAELAGMHTTVITSGITSCLDEKLKILYEHGLRSITASYDDVSFDKSSRIKSVQASQVINTFRSFGPVRDSAVVVTLTRDNYERLPDIIKQMSEQKIWTFFDLIHPNRGQAGSKVKDTDLDLLFRKEDFPPLIDVLKEVIVLKDQGFLCHTSKQYVETMKIIAGYGTALENFTPLSPYLLWNCAVADCFPSWVTVDCDGTVYPCDDFQPKNQTLIKIWEIHDLWDLFSTKWKDVTKNECPGCLWNTHIDSHLVKQGQLPITGYVHGIK